MSVRIYDILCVYICIYAKCMYNCTHPNSCNSQNMDFFMYLGKFFFWLFSFVQKIMLVGALLRAKDRGLDRAHCYSY